MDIFCLIHERDDGGSKIISVSNDHQAMIRFAEGYAAKIPAMERTAFPDDTLGESLFWDRKGNFIWIERHAVLEHAQKTRLLLVSANCITDVGTKFNFNCYINLTGKLDDVAVEKIKDYVAESVGEGAKKSDVHINNIMILD